MRRKPSLRQTTVQVKQIFIVLIHSNETAAFDPGPPSVALMLCYARHVSIKLNFGTIYDTQYIVLKTHTVAGREEERHHKQTYINKCDIWCRCDVFFFSILIVKTLLQVEILNPK